MTRLTRFYPVKEKLAEFIEFRRDVFKVILGLEQRPRGLGDWKECQETLLEITAELCEWGLGDAECFKDTWQLSVVSLEILAARDHRNDVTETFWNVYHKPCPLVQQVFDEMHEEYLNLLNVLFEEPAADLQRARIFCFALWDVAISISYERMGSRHYLAA